MKLPRRAILACLASMMLLSLALRFPRTDHEIGVDSFFIHNLATNIQIDSHAEWMINPLSLFGWFPLSYPSGGPFLLSAFSDVGGVSIEAAILVASLAFGTMGVLTAFVMARAFRSDDAFCLVVAFVYALAPRFLAFTLWSASMRSLFMVLLPMMVWSLLRAHRDAKIKNFAMVFALFFLLAATHRLAALLAVVMIASVAAVLFVVISRIVRTTFPRAFLGKAFRRSSPYIALVAFFAIAGSVLFGTDLLSAYSVGELAEGTSIDVQLLNLGVSLARSVGISLILAVAGILVIVRTPNKTLREPFLLMAFLGLTPTLFLRQYTGFYILPFIAILAGLAVRAFLALRWRTVGRVGLVAFVGVTLTFSTAVLNYEIVNSTFLVESMYSSALYIGSHGPECRLVANDGLVGIRIASVTGCPVIPVGGAGTTFQSPELLAYDFFTQQEVVQGTVRIPLQELTLESDSPWVASDIQAELDWVTIMQTPFSEETVQLARYRPEFYLENKFFAGEFFAYGNRYASAFATSVHSGAYKVYDSEAQSLWYVASSRDR